MEFSNGFATNVVIFCVNNSSSSHTDNLKNNFLVLGERPTDDINGSVGTAEKKFSTNFIKAKTIFCLSLHDNSDNSYFFVNGKEICSFKAGNKNVNFPTKFCVGSIYEKFDALGPREISSK